jgi:hypothetical protein
MALIFPPTQNGLQKTLGAQLDTGATVSATLNNTTGLQNLKGLFVVDRIDTSGAEKDAAVREYISFAGVSGSTVTTLVRGLGGTTDQDHAIGAVVEFVMDVVQMQALLDVLTAEHSVAGVHDSAVIAKLGGAQTFTGAKTFTTGLLKAVDITSGSGVNTFPTSTGTLATLALTETFTNKRITKRVVTTTDDATAVIDCGITDQYQLTAVANATEFTVTGTPTAGQTLVIRVKDAGVSKNLTFTGFTAIGCTIPTATTAGKTTYVGCLYNATASTWDVVAVTTEV